MENQKPLMKGFTWTQYREGARKLAEAYKRGDSVCMGIKREEILLVGDDFAVYVPPIALYVSKIVGHQEITPP